MTRAEEVALKVYSKGPTVNMGYEDYDQYSKERSGFIQGYKQAEKDLALTWEDIAKIDAIILDVNNEMAVDYSQEISRHKFYEEVLRRFNEAKK